MPEFPKQRHRNSCGATVVAYLAGVDLGEAEAVNGPGLTTTRKLRASLAGYGIHTEPLRRVRKVNQAGGLKRLPAEPMRRLQSVGTQGVELPGDVVKVRWSGTSRSHWAVYLGGGVYYDPGLGQRVTGFDGGRVTSFIPVRK